MSHAVKISRDKEGNEHIFHIDEWAETVAPILDWELGIKIFNDDEGNELVLNLDEPYDDTIPESEQLRELRHIDRNPPKPSIDESEMKGHSNKDYFSHNDYFMDDSGDDQTPSQTSYLSQKTQDGGKSDWKDHPKKWICTLCHSQSTEGDNAYFRHLDYTHREAIENIANGDLEHWKRSMLNEAYWNGL